GGPAPWPPGPRLECSRLGASPDRRCLPGANRLAVPGLIYVQDETTKTPRTPRNRFMPDAELILERLDRQGYRLTGPRRSVLEEVVSRQTPFTSAELLETMRRQAPGIGRATVFRTLDLLTRLGVVQRIHSDPEGGRCHAYL